MYNEYMWMPATRGVLLHAVFFPLMLSIVSQYGTNIAFILLIGNLAVESIKNCSK